MATEAFPAGKAPRTRNHEAKANRLEQAGAEALPGFDTAGRGRVGESNDTSR